MFHMRGYSMIRIYLFKIFRCTVHGFYLHWLDYVPLVFQTSEYRSQILFLEYKQVHYVYISTSIPYME